MGSHRTTIRRKKPLTHLTTTKIPRRKAIKTLHTDLKSSSSGSGSIPLAVYQQASSKGQDPLRGGDSSKVLVQWLKQSKDKEKLNGLKVLEVGCLDVDNAIAKYIERQKGSIRRIDLKSRDPRIEEQDFMTLPLNEVSSSPLKTVRLTIGIRFDFAIVGIEFRLHTTRTLCNAQKNDILPPSSILQQYLSRPIHRPPTSLRK